MAKKPAKIASAKKVKGIQGRGCPVCGGEMNIAKILRVSDASGMYWLCNDKNCASLIATSGAMAGQLDLK